MQHFFIMDYFILYLSCFKQNDLIIFKLLLLHLFLAYFIVNMNMGLFFQYFVLHFIGQPMTQLIKHFSEYHLILMTSSLFSSNDLLFKEVMISPLSPCCSICQWDYTKTTKQISMKLEWSVGLNLE